MAAWGHYSSLALTVEGTCEILGLSAGDGGEGTKYWLQILTKITGASTMSVWSFVTA